MNKLLSYLFKIILFFSIVALLSGCADLKPKLSMEIASHPDSTGSLKYQLWTGFIHVSSVDIRDVDDPRAKPKFMLKGEVARNPYKPVFLIGGENNFFSSTKITYTPLKNTRMPEKITIALEDKAAKRIEQAGTLLGAAVSTGLIALDAPVAQEDTDFITAIKSFKPWSINLAKAIAVTSLWTRDSIDICDKKPTLCEDRNNSDNSSSARVATPPEGWKYKLNISEASNTALDIRKNSDEISLSAFGNNGVVLHPSCRTATLTLTHIKSSESWTESFQIPDPVYVETAMLPNQGSMTFNECSVSVEPGETVERDYFDLVVKLAETAKSVWDAQEEKNKADSDSND